ncbi:putative reverse transcriptase domain-containing protein [Tanacetum coccineum]
MPFTWWNSYKKAVTQEVTYAMDWKALKKLMTVKYCPRELALMYGRMFPEESDKVEKYVSGLPDMIRGNVMSYRPKTMEEVIEFANDQMNQKLITVFERQAEQKRKIEFNAGNNQGYQQQTQRQITGAMALHGGTSEKREYIGSLPLCTKCNYHHKGPCAPRCNKCKRIGHLAHDCRSSRSKQYKTIEDSGATQIAIIAKSVVFRGTPRGCPKWENMKTVVFNVGLTIAPAKVMSFVSKTFSSLIDITPTALDHYYDVELADGKIIGINTIIRGSKGGTEEQVGESGLAGVPIVQDFPEVFPEELPGLRPTRQVEFQIDLMPGAVPVARAPYRLASSEMKDCREQQQD